jgi:hypothetical protein
MKTVSRLIIITLTDASRLISLFLIGCDCSGGLLRQTVALKNAVARGEFVPAVEVLRSAEIVIATFSERVLAIPGKLAESCEMRSRGEVEEIVRDELYEALDELSKPILPVNGGISQAVALIWAKAQRVAKPPPKLNLIEWADTNRFVSSKNSASPGRWSSSALWIWSDGSAVTRADAHTVTIMAPRWFSKPSS